jgi:outer membrane biogenesis lipoprotein LolB
MRNPFSVYLLKFSFSCLFLAYFGVFIGCASLIPPPVEDMQARALVNRLTANNSRLDNFKGMMNARMKSAGQTLSGRVAWIANTPDRLRLEWLNPMGQPLTSLSGNGKKLIIVSHADQKRYRLRQTSTVLEQLIEVPMGIEDLVTLLSGRPLVPEFHAAQQFGASDGGGIRLKNRWRLPLVDLYTDDKGLPLKETIYGSEGQLLYRIQWDQWMDVDGFTVPRSFRIDTESGEWVQIRIHRFIPVEDLDPAVFDLSLASPS